MITGQETSVFCFIEIQLFNKSGDNNFQTIPRSREFLSVMVLKLDRASDRSGGLVKTQDADCIPRVSDSAALR